VTLGGKNQDRVRFVVFISNASTDGKEGIFGGGSRGNYFVI